MNAIELHCQEIDHCNQRGGRMLSIVDLLDAGTMSMDLAAYLLAAIRSGASFMVGALPGGAGKTTIMGALLNFVPPDVSLYTADGLAAIAEGLALTVPRRCYICHEIRAANLYAYLWNEKLRAYFQLARKGHMLATNLHADTYQEARDQVCIENRVPHEDLLKMNLAVFIDTKGGNRKIAEVWESDGVSDHGKVYEKGKLKLAQTRLAGRDRVQEAHQLLNNLLSSGARTIKEVRAGLIRPAT